jgi:hypothetical protein
MKKVGNTLQLDEKTDRVNECDGGQVAQSFNSTDGRPTELAARQHRAERDAFNESCSS